MTVFTTVLLVMGMGAIGAPLLLSLVAPLFGAVIGRTLPEHSWDLAMNAFCQAFAALTTYLIGVLVLGLPWYAALPAGLAVGVTSYARRTE